jgi:diguanylate cyclase (GGDEF)-like protein
MDSNKHGINLDSSNEKDDYHSDMHLELKIDEPVSKRHKYEKDLGGVKPAISIDKHFTELRTKQLIFTVLMTVIIAYISNHFIQKSVVTSQILLVSLFIFSGCYWLVSKGKTLLGGTILLWSLYIIMSLLLIGNDGLRDPVVIGYTAILIFAALLGNRKHFISLTSIMAVTILSVGYANHAKWIDYSNAPFDWGIVIDLLMIFIIISYAIWTLINDLRFSLSHLKNENTKINLSKQEFQKIAQFDNLTGLPNRVKALESFNKAMNDCSNPSIKTNKIAVLFLDLDNFKTVNDSLGHSIGDLLLQEIARRLKSSVGRHGTVCRLGGDEFLAILSNIDKNKDITIMANNILSNVSKPINIEEHELTVTFSIGVSVSPEDGVDFDDLRKKSDMAMYRAKKSGRNAFIFFDDEMNKDMLAHIDRVNSLRNAISNNELELFYQPKIDLSSNKIFSAEALIRWRTSTGELVMPDEFIPIAENTGLIIEIGEWVLFEACRQCKEFQLNGLSDFSIAVNLSSIQFRRGNLETIVNNALEYSGLHPSYLELEVTETLLIENSTEIRRQINSLQKLGVTFTIDDFGTGYSSFSYLRDFQFNFIKIDRSFIGNNLEEDMILCEAIIGMAHKLKLMVVAEGVETKEQKDALAAIGCEYCQGNYFSRAVPVDEFYQLQCLPEITISNKY